MGRYEGCMESPWDDISIQYVLVCMHVAKRRYMDTFTVKRNHNLFVFLGKSHRHIFAGYSYVSLPKIEVGRYLPCSLNLRDLSFDVGSLIIYNPRFRQLIIFFLAGRLPIQQSEEWVHGRISLDHCQSIWKMYDRHPHSSIRCIS